MCLPDAPVGSLPIGILAEEMSGRRQLLRLVVTEIDRWVCRTADFQMRAAEFALLSGALAVSTLLGLPLLQPVTQILLKQLFFHHDSIQV